MAEERARAGAKVVLSSRTAEADDKALAELAAQGFDVLAQPCNVSRREDLKALVEATRAKWQRIDIVVANAATNPYYGPLTGIDDEAFDKIVANNVKSVLWLAPLTLPAMKGGGSFILLGSVGGPPGQPGGRGSRLAYGGGPPPAGNPAPPRGRQDSPRGSPP